jgi:hypothetical protein
MRCAHAEAQMPMPFVSEPIELRRWAWRRWPWRAAIILKARECRAGTLRGRQLRGARHDVLRDIHLRLPSIEPTPTGDHDVSLEEEWVIRFDEMAASLGDEDNWHSLWQEAMAQGRVDFAAREREYREQAAREVRDRAATLLDRLGAYAKAILRQSRYRVIGCRAETNTGHVERNRTTLTADDFAVFSVDLLNGCLVDPGVGLKYVGVTVREIQIADGDGRGEFGLAEEPGSVPGEPGAEVITSIEPFARRDEPGEAADSSEGSMADLPPSNDLRPASVQKINNAITAVYDEAERTGGKPPNIRELPKPVQEELRKTGHTASGNRIMQLGEAEQHDRRRRKPGKTIASEKRADFTK